MGPWDCPDGVCVNSRLSLSYSKRRCRLSAPPESSIVVCTAAATGHQGSVRWTWDLVGVFSGCRRRLSGKNSSWKPKLTKMKISQCRFVEVWPMMGLVLKWPYLNNQKELEAQIDTEMYLKMCLILPWARFGCAVAAWWVAATVNLTENRPKWPTQWTCPNQALFLFYLLFQEGMQGQDRTTYLRVN